MKRTLRIAWVLAVLGLLVVAAYVRVPYYAVGPGPARSVEPLIDFSGRPRYPSSGQLIMTTVRWYQVTPLQALVAWWEPHEAVVSRDVLYPGGQDAGTEQRRSISQMDQSKIDATSVVLRALEGYPRTHGDGALVEGVGPGCPAEGKLYAGDTITSIDGTPVATLGQASRILARAARGTSLSFRVRAAGQTHDIRVMKGSCPNTTRALVGVSLVDAFPFPISISSGDIGGPSAGLMFALGLYDALTPGDLTRGRTIAGTGTIDTRGRIGPIGGITDKVVAAQDAGATLFLVPRANMPELRGVDTGNMRLIPVATFTDALDALRGN